ncbi:MAG TPA: hypothetical protein VNK96_04000 [Fimbriimonadales bacterium]|nr:hypothetical protein [Fimbriimonadales bacterium]
MAGKPKLRETVFALCALALFAGCSKPPAPPFPNRLEGYVPDSPSPGFALYQQAAKDVEQLPLKLLKRTKWTLGQKQSAIVKCAAALQKIARAQRSGVSFVFTPYSPFDPPKERRGWSFLGKVMKWQIEEALVSENYSHAVAVFLRCARFGVDISGGDAIDANLGLTLVNDASIPIWKAFPKMSSRDLRSLYEGYVHILQSAPTLESVLRHERATMLQVVQSIQDAYLAGDLEKFTKVGNQLKPAVDYLERLKSRPYEEQIRYFDGFAQEAEEEIRNVSRANYDFRQVLNREPKNKERPWKRFAAHYFRSAQYLLPLWKETHAKMRLMALDAALMARVKAGKTLPNDLSNFPEWLRTDPFSGKDFLYVPRGSDYVLYSVGVDSKDDGGDRLDLRPTRLEIAR